MCRPWAKYKGAGRLQYETSSDHDVTVSWAIQIIMGKISKSRWRRGNRQETISPIMELSEPATSLRILLLELPAGRCCGSVVKKRTVCRGNGRGSIFIILSWSSAIMAPKRSTPPSTPDAPRRPQTRRATKEQERAAQSAKYFKNNIPPEVQADIEMVEQKVWAEVEQGIPDAEFDELANWIQDPGKTCGRMALYQRAITYFWVAKCISARSAMEQRPRDPKAMAPAPLWNLHFNDSRLMHRKLDLIAKKLGILFCAPEAVLASKAVPRSANGQDPQPSNSQVP